MGFGTVCTAVTGNGYLGVVATGFIAIAQLYTVLDEYSQKGESGGN